ncbi:hypothetical protein HMPREF1548_00390 [Clostridium sp. KLE 1755]|nr:hypothetical protein HMPREF1548_00390 [Clostridium sp. KLE 1755]
MAANGRSTVNSSPVPCKLLCNVRLRAYLRKSRHILKDYTCFLLPFILKR